ncbi:hypothetical protein pEaSNUABM29_00102 [Erwinia phage pEa_SNUABM_29]|nr:hypothetical protein pEaSNUABM29_00102 [Erwinia phage pEa_SNUABM_29]
MTTRTCKTVYRYSITESAQAIARRLTSCPMRLTDVLGSMEGFYLIFGQMEPVFHKVEDPSENLEILNALGEKSPSEIKVGVDKHLVIAKDKHGPSGIQCARWHRGIMAYL